MSKIYLFQALLISIILISGSSIRLQHNQLQPNSVTPIQSVTPSANISMRAISISANVSNTTLSTVSTTYANSILPINITNGSILPTTNYVLNGTKVTLPAINGPIVKPMSV